MNIIYKKFTEDCLDSVIELEKTWAKENITYGIEQSDRDMFLKINYDYFHLAFDENIVIAYIIGEIIEKNEYNIFPKEATYLRVNDLYVLKEYRNKGIGEKLLSKIENIAKNKGIKHIFISTATKDTESITKFYKRNGFKIWTTLLFKNIDE